MKMIPISILKVLFKTLDNVVDPEELEDDLLLYTRCHSTLDVLIKSHTQVHFLKDGTVEVHVGEDHQVRGRFTMIEVLDLTTEIWTDLDPDFRSMIFRWSTSLTLTGGLL